MSDLANRGNDALYNTHGKFYEAGCIPCVLYVASGTSLDWALGVAGIGIAAWASFGGPGGIGRGDDSSEQ